MESEPTFPPQYWKDGEKIDLPENCHLCKLMFFHCDFTCWHASEECFNNLRYHEKKKEKWERKKDI